MIPVTLSSSNHLYLTQTEAERLANHLHQELICRTANQSDEPVVVADAFLTVADAWRLVDRLDTSIDETVDWPTEGS